MCRTPSPKADRFVCTLTTNNGSKVGQPIGIQQNMQDAFPKADRFVWTLNTTNGSKVSQPTEIQQNMKDAFPKDDFVLALSRLLTPKTLTFQNSIDTRIRKLNYGPSFAFSVL